MAHQRTVIRRAVRDLLMHRTGAQDHVVATRIHPWRKGELPAISVYTLEERVDEETASAPEIMRELDLEIAGFVHAAEGVDDQMDELALEIENVMAADPFLGGAAAEVVLRSTTLGIAGEGDTLTGMVTLTYAVSYRTSVTEEASNLDDFLTVDARHRVGAPDPVQDGHDDFVVQEIP